MDMACSPTFVLIVTLLAWALLASLAFFAAPSALHGEDPKAGHASRKQRAHSQRSLGRLARAKRAAASKHSEH
jgi:hypothetical protein